MFYDIAYRLHLIALILVMSDIFVSTYMGRNKFENEGEILQFEIEIGLITEMEYICRMKSKTA